jgi:hypothetical protein
MARNLLNASTFSDRSTEARFNALAMTSIVRREIDDDLTREPCHAREEPGRRFAGVKRE